MAMASQQCFASVVPVRVREEGGRESVCARRAIAKAKARKLIFLFALSHAYPPGFNSSID